VRLAAHGIEIDLPAGWEGRIYRRPAAQPTLHAANFRLPERDGDFASGATGAMPHGGVVLVLKEYGAGPKLTPGTGLFASSTLPLPIRGDHFHPRCLQVGRPGQAGLQHFFTVSGRPFCLYAVVNGLSSTAPDASQAADELGHLNRILSSLRLHPQR
jgi:hypothetical protein